jgi:hypothetical protein
MLSVCVREYQSKLNRPTRKALDEMYEDELIFATTTQSKIMNSTSPSDRLWSKINIDDDIESVRLTDLITSAH